jgi:5-formyltetrahydrofolate cyclo-ligase
VPQNVTPTHIKATNRVCLRKLLLAQRYCIGSAEREARQGALVSELAAYIKQHHANSVVALYMSHAGEPSILELSRLIDNPLCLPVVVNKAAPLEFAPWQSQATLANDRYGIPTPTSCARIDPQLLLIPCLGYTGSGLRLGYGGGYYDRTLPALYSKNAHVMTIGIAWRQSRCDFQPNQHDIEMQYIHTA